MKKNRPEKQRRPAADGQAVARLIEGDQWAADAGTTHDGPWMLRWREPLLARHDVVEYTHCVQIVWDFAPEGAGVALDPETQERMAAFEVLLRAALERDALAVLTAILTFDGARQWVFYTRDVASARSRIEAMPQSAEPFPIELGAFEDPAWEVLRDDILGGMRGGDDD